MAWTNRTEVGSTPRPAAPATSIALAFLAVYLIWGSTYLAIRVTIESMPPFLMAGLRFLLAGALLYAWMRFRGAPKPSSAHWKSAVVIGGLLLLGGNGAVVWAEQRVPSGLTSLLVAIVPLWVVLLDWRMAGARPSIATASGVAVAFTGIAILVAPGALAGQGGVDLAGAGILLGGTLCWALGSLLSRRLALPSVGLQASSMELLGGGALLILASVLLGEPTAFDPARVTGASAAAWLYLVVFGALIGFTCYIWLLRVQPASRVATYAFVNPVVAVALGSALAGEPFTANTALASAVIVAGVAVTTLSSARPAPDRGLLRPPDRAGPARRRALAPLRR